MDKEKLLDWLMLIGIIIMIIVGIFLIVYYKDKAGLCVADPVAFYEYSKNATCFCVP